MAKKIFADLEYLGTKILEAITGHNASNTAHQDIREAIQGIDVSTQVTDGINTHNTDANSHQSIQDKINLLSINRGYGTSNKDLTDFNLLVENGKYLMTTGAINGPVSGSFTIVVDVTIQASHTLVHKATVLWGTNASTSYERVRTGGTWGAWKTTPTTDDTIVKVKQLVSGDDLNSCTQINKYYSIVDSAGILNKPTQMSNLAHNSTVYVFSPRPEAIMQVMFTANFNMILTRTYTQWGNPNWSDWKQIATTEKIDITLQNGWRTYDATYPAPHVIYTGGVYKVNGCIVNPSAITSTSIIGSISTNLPTSKVNCHGYSTVDTKMYCLQIQPNGIIYVLSSVSANVPILL